MMSAHATDATLITGIAAVLHILPGRMMTGPIVHLTALQPVADEVRLLKEAVPLLANPLHTKATTLVVEIIHLLIQITIELTSLTLIRIITPAPLPLPPMIDIDAQFLQTIVVEITAAFLGRLHVGHIVIISTTFAHPPALFV
jgi:hypothetical protein